MLMLLFWFPFTFNTSSQVEKEKEVFMHHVLSNYLALKLPVFIEARLPSGGE
jgi:hypothetical protein